MKKKLLFMFLAAGLFFAGCSDGSSGSSGGNDDNTQGPGSNPPQTSPEAPELPSTYVDISGTWYYTAFKSYGTVDQEYKLTFIYNETKDLPDQLKMPLAVCVDYEIFKADGGFKDKGTCYYDRINNRFYDNRLAAANVYSIISKAGNDNISVKHYNPTRNGNIFLTEETSTVLSRTSGSSGGSDPQGPGNPGSEDLTLSGLYSVAEQSGVTLTFNSNGTWEKVYNGLQRKEGTFSQSGSTVTLTFNGKNAEFTVSSSNGKLILTAKNTSDADTISVIATGLQLSSSVASGKVTLSK